MKRLALTCAILAAICFAHSQLANPDARAASDNVPQALLDALKEKDGARIAQMAPTSYEALILSLKHKDADVRLGAVEALISYFHRDARNVEPLIEVLKDENKRVRQRAASALYPLRDKRAVEPLIAVLKDEDRDVRSAAADTLGALGDVRAVQPLLAMLESEKDRQDGAEYMVVSALGRLGDPRAVEPLLGVLANARSPSLREAAAVALGNLRDKRVVGPLVEALRNPGDPLLRAAAAKGLGTAASADALYPLIAALNDDDYQVVREAVVALGNLKDGRAVGPLCDFLNNKRRDGLYRSSVPEALRILGDRRAIAPLVEAMKDSNHFVRIFAARALAGLHWQPTTDLQRAYCEMATEKWDEAVKYGPTAVEPLLVALKTLDEPKARQAAAQALTKLHWQPANETEKAYLLVAQRDWDDAAKLGPPAVEPLLLVVAGSMRPEYVTFYQSAHRALLSIGPGAFDPLLAALESKEAYRSLMAAKILGEMGGNRAVEPLIAVLKDASNPEGLRSEAANALGQLRDKRAVEPLIVMLKDKSPRCRQRAAAALHELRDPRAIEPLTAALKDDDKSVRESATFALATLGKTPTADSVAKQLQDPSAEVRASAAMTLAQMGDKRALEPSLLALKDKDPKVRRQAAEALRTLRDKRAVEPLITALKDDDKGVRYSAASALGTLGDAQAVEPLISALKDQDTWSRGGVAGALGSLGDKRAIEPLRAVLKRDDGTVITAVAVALAQLVRDETAVEPLLAALEHPDSEWVGLEVLGTVITLGPRAVKPLTAALQHRNVKVRRAVVEMLAIGSHEGAVEALLAALKDPDGDVARSVAFRLAELDDPRALEPLAAVLKDRKSALWRKSEVPRKENAEPGRSLAAGAPLDLAPLIVALESEHWQLRLSAAWVLGRQGDKRATDALAVTLKTAERSGQSDEQTRGTWLCSQALARLGSPRALPPLLNLIKQESAHAAHPDEPREAGAWMRRMQQKRTSQLVEAFAAVGPPAVEPLIALLKDENPRARDLAAQGLGRLGDKRALDALKVMLKDPDQQVSQSTAAAIRAIEEK